jgi:hypothetical protein
MGYGISVSEGLMRFVVLTGKWAETGDCVFQKTQ